MNLQLIGNGRVITWEKSRPFLPDGCLAVHDNLIVDIGPTQEMKDKYPGTAFLDAKNMVIMPGLINTHMHFYGAFARGLALKDAPPETFQQILERLWWRLDKVLTLEDVYYSATVILIDCIKNGVTTVFDHHASPGAVRESLFTVARAARRFGVRCCLCYEVSDRDGERVARQGIAENVEFINYCAQQKDDLIRGMFGLHASLTLGDKTLHLCQEANASLGAGYHIHAAEGREDVVDCLSRYGKSVIKRLADLELLGSKTITAHCVHVDEDDIDLLHRSRTNVVHNPESNLGNAVGCAPVIEMLNQGVNVGLGTDGYTSDMFESLKVASILHRYRLANPQTGWVEAPEMLFYNNAEICTAQFDGVLGKFTAGAKADIIIVDYNPPTPMREDNISAHVLFGLTGRMVDTVIIDGRLVMRKRRLPGIDEAEIVARARELAAKVWQRF